MPVLIAAERPRCWRRFWSEELSLTDPMEFPPVVGTGSCADREPTLDGAPMSSYVAKPKETGVSSGGFGKRRTDAVL